MDPLSLRFYVLMSVSKCNTVENAIEKRGSLHLKIH